MHAAVIVRQRLVDRILASNVALVIVSGPAGSGKSIVLAQAHAAVPTGVWVSASPRDVDAVVFWTAVIESTSLILPGFGDDYRRPLDVVGAAAVADVVPLVVNELAGADRPITIFLDDVHLLTDDRTRRSLTQFLELLPANVRVVMAGRGAAPVPLGRLRLQGDLLEIGQRELQMDDDEARAMLEVKGLSLEPAQLRALLDRTEGWVAGLAWAAIALQRRSDTDGFVDALAAAEGDIANYLVEEVIEWRSPEERQFMLETSILASFCAELCDAVRARSDSRGLLEALDDSDTFLIALDPAAQWHRFHHLVHEVLGAQLKSEQPNEIRDLHRRASAWHRDHGGIDEAIWHALAADDQIEAAEILCANWWELLATGRSETAEALFRMLGPETIRQYQPLAIAAAEFYSVTGNRALGRHFCDVAEQGTFDGDPPDGTACIESTLALMRAALVFDGVAQSLADAELAYALEPPGSPWRPFAALFVGLGRTWQGDLDGAVPYFDEVAAWVPPNQPLVVYALAETALADLARGDLAAAIAGATSACQRAEENGIDSLFLSATAYAAKAHVDIAAGDHHAAVAALRAADVPMDRVATAMPMDAMRARILLADAAMQLGFTRLARAHVEQAEIIDREIADTGVLSGELAVVRARLEQMVEAGEGVVSFSDRELQVLELLPTELTVREIGTQLFLSKNTIKTYIRRIYQELDVTSRDDAVSRARQLDALPQS